MTIRNHSPDGRESGFTLIELLVVVIIIAILAAIAIPVFLQQRIKAYDTAVKSDLRNLAQFEEGYLEQNNTYATIADITASGDGVVEAGTPRAAEHTTHFEVADRWGNLVYRKTARNFGPIMAMAAKHAIAQVGEVVELGALDPESVITPGIFVQAVVPVAAAQRQGLAA